VVITPFVLSAGFTVVALYALKPLGITRITYMHRSFNATLIGFIYIPGFIIVINLIIYFIHQPQGVIPPAVFAEALIAGIAIAVPIGILARKSKATLRALYDQEQEIKKVSPDPFRFVYEAVEEKLAASKAKKK
jgi:hypothetical protein